MLLKNAAKVTGLFGLLTFFLPVSGFATDTETVLDVVAYAPSSTPSVLQVNTGEVNVVFKVYVNGDASIIDSLRLNRQDIGSTYILNDDGVSGDQIAGDGVYGTEIAIDTATLAAEECITFFSLLAVGEVRVHSSTYDLCGTSFPPRYAPSNTDQSNFISDGEDGHVVADELLVSFPGVSEEVIIKTVASIGAQVVGSLTQFSRYQIRFSSPKSLIELNAAISELLQDDIVADAFLNPIAAYSSIPSDLNFSNQHGLTLIRAHEAWDLGGTGSGVTITIVDSGVNNTIDDFIVTGKVVDRSVSSRNGFGDNLNHGTAVAGIVAAESNTTGIAGVAPDSTVETVKIAGSVNFSLTDLENAMIQAGSASGRIVNISANSAIRPSTLSDEHCQIVNDIVFAGTPVPQKIIVNSAGNNGISTSAAYPSLCNNNVDAFNSNGVLIDTYNVTLTDKSLLISVANSISCSDTETTDCDSALIDTLHSTSNFGSMVDVAAPGSFIYTTQNDGTYDYGNGPGEGSIANDTSNFTNPVGTSFSAAMVSGAAAILLSCDVPIGSVEAALQAGALNDVDPDADRVLPRIDVMEALGSVNTAPTGLSIDVAAIDELVGAGAQTTAPLTVGKLSTMSDDACDAFTYSIVDNDNNGNSFQIAGDSLEFVEGVVLDYESQNSYEVTVRTTDAFDQTFDETLTVALNDVPENTASPVLIAKDASGKVIPDGTTTFFPTFEGVPNGTVIGLYEATDADGDSTSLAFNIGLASTKGAFEVDPVTGQVFVSDTSLLNSLSIHWFIVTVTDGSLGDADVAVVFVASP